MAKCYFCDVDLVESNQSRQSEGDIINCNNCGYYRITKAAIRLIKDEFKMISSNRHNIMGWISEQNEPIVDESVIRSILNLKNLTITEKFEKILKYLEAKTEYPGQQIETQYLSIYPDKISIASWSKNREEAHYLIQYLEKMNYIQVRESGLGNATTFLSIKPEGYLHLQELKKSVNDIGFCAMWFDKSLDPAWENAIKPAIEECGYKAVRIDKHPHNEGIVDKIKSIIRQSKFVVADLTSNSTGDRGGVYYEAGFADGLNISLILTCNTNYFDKIHFDLKHINPIKWDENNYDEFN